MAALDRLINIQITTDAPSAPRKGFGTLLILGPNGAFPERVRTYADMDAVAEDFEAGDPEYIAANRAFSQAVRPQTVKIARGTTALVAQVTTVTVTTPIAPGAYTLTLNGTAYTYTATELDTAGDVAAGLTAAVNAGTHPVTAATAGANTVLTADVAGVGFTVATTTNMTTVATTANAGPTTDLDAVSAADDDWYGLVITARTAGAILGTAGWAETREKLFVACSDEAAVLTTATTDVASVLKARSYAHTAYMWSADQAAYPEAAWLGGELPKQPGSSTYKFKTLVGVAPDNLTETQLTSARAKNVNVYRTVAGMPITEEGMVAVGEFIDVIVGRDWIKSTMQSDIYDVLRRTNKVPMTDAGVTQIAGVVGNVLQLAVTYDVLKDFTVTQPRVVDIPNADRSARRLSGITGSGHLAGAAHFVDPIRIHIAV